MDEDDDQNRPAETDTQAHLADADDEHGDITDSMGPVAHDSLDMPVIGPVSAYAPADAALSIDMDSVIYSTSVWSRDVPTPTQAVPQPVYEKQAESSSEQASSESGDYHSVVSPSGSAQGYAGESAGVVKSSASDASKSDTYQDAVAAIPRLTTTVTPEGSNSKNPVTETSTTDVEEPEDAEEELDEFVFHAPVAPFPSSASNQDIAAVEPLYLPRLCDILNEEQKMAFAALCVLTFNEMMQRYAHFEFIDIQPVRQERRFSDKLQLQYDKMRRKSVDESPLLDFDAEEANALDDSDDEGTLLSRRSSVDPASRRPAAKLVTQYTKNYRPFADQMANPETIEDVVFLGRKIDGNLALCYAIKTYQAWCQDITERIYGELNISQNERLFIEQSLLMGLEPADLTKCLIPSKNESYRPSIQILRTLDLEQGVEDTRPLILWNLALLLLSADNTRYDSRSRSFLRRIAVDHLRFGTWTDVVENVEVPITEFPVYCQARIFQAGVDTTAKSRSSSSLSGAEGDADDNGDNMEVPRNTSMLLSNNEKEIRHKRTKKKRIAFMTAAAVGGGALIGITTGLAAPMLGAGLGACLAAMKIAGATTFFGSVGGSALITSGGVLTGASLAFKMAKRTDGVKVFQFIPIHASRDRPNIVISITGWITSKEGRGKTVPINRRQQQSTSGAKQPEAAGSDTADGRKRSGSTTTKSTAEPVEVEKEQDMEEVIANGLGDLMVPFMGASPSMGSHYALCFDPDILLTLGDALKIFASEIISFSANQLLQQTILATLLSAMNWPMWLLKLGYLVDNPWSLGLDRAEKAGLILADALCNNVNAGRPVTLVGYSLGARVIYHCLVELAMRGKYGIVEDVYMFGTPVLFARATPQPPKSSKSSETLNNPFESAHVSPVNVTGLTAASPNALKSLDEWRLAASVVSGRLVNCFSRVDWVLGFLFRASGAGMWDVAGLNAVVLDDETSPDVVVMSNEAADDTSKPVFSSPAAAAAADTPNDTTEATTDNEPIPPPLSTSGDRSGDSKWREMHIKPAVVYNIDVTALVQGHMSYRNAMPMLMRRICGYECWTDDIEVIEEMVGGEWMDQVDGWWEKSRSSTAASLIGLQRSKRKSTSTARPDKAAATSSANTDVAGRNTADGNANTDSLPKDAEPSPELASGDAVVAESSS